MTSPESVDFRVHERVGQAHRDGDGGLYRASAASKDGPRVHDVIRESNAKAHLEVTSVVNRTIDTTSILIHI